MLQKTTNLLDEAERMLSPSDKDVESPKRPSDSNLLDSNLPDSQDASG